MTEKTWDELDNQIDLFMSKVDEDASVTDYQRGLIAGNLRGFCSQIREWGYGRPRLNNPED